MSDDGKVLSFWPLPTFKTKVKSLSLPTPILTRSDSSPLGTRRLRKRSLECTYSEVHISNSLLGLFSETSPFLKIDF